MNYTTIIPTHNRPDLVARALRSVHAQTAASSEIIVIDDASNPPLALPEELCNTRTRVIRLENSCGGAAARNVGLNRATCPYVAFLDDDDEWLPSKMEKQLAYFESHPNAVLVSCGHLRIEGGSTYHEVYSGDFVNRYFHYDNFLGSFSYLVVRQSNHRLDPALPSLQDWDFALGVTRTAKFGILEEPLVNYYGHKQPRITTRRMNRLKGLRKCYLKHRRTFSRDERRWWISQIIFERSLYASGRALRRRMVTRSIRMAAGCNLPWGMKARAIAGKAGSLLVDKGKLVAIRSFCLSGWQRLGRWFSRPAWTRGTHTGELP